MLRSSIICAGLSLAVLCGTYVVGCGDSTVDDTTPTGPGVRPPDPVDGAPAGDGSGYTYAVSKLFLGDTNRDGSPNPNAWQNYGYDIDGQQTADDFTNHCTPKAGANPAKVFPDGKDGIDNSFGRTILEIITGLVADASAAVNEQIEEGSFTIIMSLDTLGDGANYSGIPSYLNIGADLGATPKFDGTDMWPIYQELLSNPADPKSTQLSFPDSYVNDGTWVSGTPGRLDLAVSVAGFSLTLNIENAVITMDLDNPRSNGATNGVISGYIPVEPFLAELEKIAGAFDENLCMGSTLEAIKDEIRKAADMPLNGAQNGSGECEAISIGLGFEAKPVQIGPIEDPQPPAEDPCNPSSTGGSGAGGMGMGGMGTGGAGGA